MTVRSGPLRIRYCRPATAVAGSSSSTSSNTIGNSINGEPKRRVAYVLSKKLGSAPARNRLRRQIRAILTDLAAKDADFFPAGDYLVGLQPSPQAKGASATERKQAHAWGYHRLSEHIHTALGKLQVRLGEDSK